MISNNSIERLQALIQLDINASYAYAKALEHIQNPLIKQRVNSFYEDHLLHIQNLSICVQSLGGEPPTFKKDLKGHLIQGFTTLRSITGEEGALKAMHSNEELTNQVYGKALEDLTDLPTEIIEIIRDNYLDEIEHLEYFSSQIAMPATAS